MDPDLEPVTLTATGLPAGAMFYNAINTVVAGAWIWQPTVPFVYWNPTSSEVGNYTVTFTAKDARGGTSSETITITVTPPP